MPPKISLKAEIHSPEVSRTTYPSATVNTNSYTAPGAHKQLSQLNSDNKMQAGARDARRGFLRAPAHISTSSTFPFCAHRNSLPCFCFVQGLNKTSL